jgi:hypothetical protein
MRAAILYLLRDHIDPRHGIGNEVVFAIIGTARPGDARPPSRCDHRNIGIPQPGYGDAAMQYGFDRGPVLRWPESPRLHGMHETVEVIA